MATAAADPLPDVTAFLRSMSHVRDAGRLSDQDLAEAMAMKVWPDTPFLSEAEALVAEAVRRLSGGRLP